MREDLTNQLPLVKLRVLIKDLPHKSIVEIVWIEGRLLLQSKVAQYMRWSWNNILIYSLSTDERLLLLLLLILECYYRVFFVCNWLQWLLVGLLQYHITCSSILYPEYPSGDRADIAWSDRNLDACDLSYDWLILARLYPREWPNHVEHILLFRVFLDRLMSWIVMLLVAQ